MASTKSALSLLDDLIAELNVSVTSVQPVSLTQTAQKKVTNSVGSDSSAKPTAQPASASSSKEPLTVNSIDFRVGRIVKVEKHQTAEKLYIEEIDVGEDAPRPIASGLVPYYSLEEMQNRLIIVVCNLKPRNLVGFKSHGMVLCAAANVDGQERVEFVDPPAGSSPGDRIIGKGLTGAPLTPNQVDKQKAFEAIASGLKVIDGVAMWNDVPLITSEGGSCTAPTIKSGVLR